MVPGVGFVTGLQGFATHRRGIPPKGWPYLVCCIQSVICAIAKHRKNLTEFGKDLNNLVTEHLALDSTQLHFLQFGKFHSSAK